MNEILAKKIENHVRAKNGQGLGPYQPPAFWTEVWPVLLAAMAANSFDELVASLKIIGADHKHYLANLVGRVPTWGEVPFGVPTPQRGTVETLLSWDTTTEGVTKVVRIRWATEDCNEVPFVTVNVSKLGTFAFSNL